MYLKSIKTEAVFKEAMNKSDINKNRWSSYNFFLNLENFLIFFNIQKTYQTTEIYQFW